MGQLTRASFEDPGEVRNFDKGKAELVDLGGATIGRFTFQPGWRWSESVKPVAGTDRCESEHLGVALSGSLRVLTDEGEFDVDSGAAYHIPPGHDAWVLGEEDFVGLEFKSAASYGKPS